MNALNLNRLNVNVPYSVWQVSDGSYGFKTDFGVLYRVAFTRDQTIWEEDAYEFAILNENQKTSPSDKNLRETVFCLIEEFFLVNPKILLYQCETGDNRQAIRDRLFLRWFNEYEFRNKYCIEVSEIIAEGISNFIAVIIQKSNPDADKILDDFRNFVGFFSNKPC